MHTIQLNNTYLTHKQLQSTPQTNAHTICNNTIHVGKPA